MCPVTSATIMYGCTEIEHGRSHGPCHVVQLGHRNNLNRCRFYLMCCDWFVSPWTGVIWSLSPGNSHARKITVTVTTIMTPKTPTTLQFPRNPILITSPIPYIVLRLEPSKEIHYLRNDLYLPGRVILCSSSFFNFRSWPPFSSLNRSGDYFAPGEDICFWGSQPSPPFLSRAFRTS